MRQRSAGGMRPLAEQADFLMRHKRPLADDRSVAARFGHEQAVPRVRFAATGDGRLFFNCAPDPACKLAGTFVVAGGDVPQETIDRDDAVTAGFPAGGRVADWRQAAAIAYANVAALYARP